MAEPLVQAVAAEAQTPAPVATTTAATTAEPVATTTTTAATTAEPTAAQLHPIEEQEHQIVVDEVSISAPIEGQPRSLHRRETMTSLSDKTRFPGPTSSPSRTSRTQLLTIVPERRARRL